MIPNRGFTLVEMAVVIAVVALLLGSILVPLATQLEERRFAEAKRMLEDAREALVGFAVVNGRLPCPASNTSNGAEDPPPSLPPPSPVVCTAPYSGFLPAVTLGISPTDAQGYAVDPWGNRIRYAVSTVATAHGAVYTNNTLMAGMSAQMLDGTLKDNPPDLQVCSTATGVTGAPPSCAAGSLLARNAPAVVYSFGPNGISSPTSADELENRNNDRLFVSRGLAAAGAAGGEFDDVVVWLSPNVLFNRMVTAGKLP